MRLVMNRRDFLALSGAGAACAAAASLPVWGTGCNASTSGEHQIYFDRFGVGSSLLRRILDKGLSRGGDFSEIFLQHKITHWTGMQDNQVDRAYSQVELGAGIRVLKGEATGFAYCEDLSESALLRAAETAAAVADASAEARVQPLLAGDITSRYPVAVPWSEIGTDQKLPLLTQANAAARAVDDRIVRVTIYLGDETSHVLIANSEGRLVEDDQPMTIMYLTCVAMDGQKVETASEVTSSRDGLGFFTPSRLTQLGQVAAGDALEMFSAVPPPIGEHPVVLAAGTSGILLHEAIGHGMEADFNRIGTSIYSDMIDKRVAHEDVTIIDDGTNGRLRGSLNVDDEGVEAQKTVLVENGILRSYLHDRISSKHYGIAPTGSGRRQSFRYPPNPRMRNTYMLGAQTPPEDIIASVDKGIYAEKFANGEVRIGAGDFTFYLTQGRMIENGKLTNLVKDANLIGNGPKVLEHIDMVGNDMTMYSGGGNCGKDGQFVPVGFGLPTVRAGSISIGGRNA